MDKKITHSLYTPVTTKPAYPKSKLLYGSSFKQQFELAKTQPRETELKISKHAKQRMDERDIQIEQSQWRQLAQKVVEARRMGVNDSLVLMENVALIVSAKNNTVVTAMNREETKSQIFTNINGTIVIE
nr:TIGR02530 family flagellar biosynthesis protein [Priestia abyssalis]